MASIEKKIDRMQHSIMETAKEKARALRQQADDYRKAQLEQAENEVLEELYTRIQEEVADIHSGMSQNLSRKEIQSRNALLLKREELTHEVFTAVKHRLMDFVKTPAYKDCLLETAKRLAADYALEDTTLLVRREDYTLSAELERAFGCPCRLLVDEDIAIGGLRLMNQGAGIYVDETLDARLQELHPWFYLHSGLNIV